MKRSDHDLAIFNREQSSASMVRACTRREEGQWSKYRRRVLTKAKSTDLAEIVVGLGQGWFLAGGRSTDGVGKL